MISTSVRIRCAVVVGLLLWPSFLSLRAQDTGWDTKSDTWVLTDSLGRTVSGYLECGPPRSDRTIAMFYFLWLGQHHTDGPFDITQILAADPENPTWGPLNNFHHWGESELGYYLSTDPYVYRKHAAMLVDAGVDTLIFDVSNRFTYKSAYMTLCSVFQQIRDEGGRTPQIAFMTPFIGDSGAIVQTLYDDLYGPNLYPDLWFRWESKPLIMADPDHVTEPLLSFFTFRKCRSGYFSGPNGPNQWGWLQVYPPHVFYSDSDPVEEMPVGVAQNAVGPNLAPFSEPGARGRSWRDGAMSPDPDAVFRGLNFEEQWQYALEVDPKVIFVTGWNEWVAQRLTSFMGYTGDALFVDAYTQEYSRDIEPMKGGHSDLYYYQTIDYIRRFKGVRLPEKASPPKTILIDGSFSDWNDVEPEFRDTIGDTMHRNHPGWGSAGTYINTTGRNDLRTAKVAYDDEHVYFFVSTERTTTPYTDPNWMLLFIDVDSDRSTGWEGYDYRVNGPPLNSTRTTLKRNIGGWNWTLVSDVSYRLANHELELAIPRADLGLADASDLTFDFHWADNVQVLGDVDEFSISGDSAPNRKFNYRYNSDITSPAVVTDLTGVAVHDRITLSWTPPADADHTGVVVRYSTVDYPADPTDGESPGGFGYAAPTQTVDIAPLARGTYYCSVFAYDERVNYSPAARISVFVRAEPGQATDPSPPDHAIRVATDVELSWEPGVLVAEHEVYFGSDPDVLVLQSSQTMATFDPGQLDPLQTYYWRVNEVNGPETVIGPVWRFTTLASNADLDDDGDVDMTDFGLFQVCYSGLGIEPSMPSCAASHLDDDDDVDQDDFAVFESCMSGPDIPADPACVAYHQINPSYEDPTGFLNGWSSCLAGESSIKHNPGSYLPTPRFHDGNNSVGMSTDRSGERLGAGAIYQEVTVLPGLTYRVRFWGTLTDAAGHDDDFIQLRIRDGDSSPLSCSDNGAAIEENSTLYAQLDGQPRTEWVPLEGEIVPSQNVITVIAYWKFAGTEWGVKALHLDDWSIWTISD